MPFVSSGQCTINIIDSSDVSCNAGNDGYIVVSGSGGLGTYHYSLQIYNSNFNYWQQIGQSPLGNNFTYADVTFSSLTAQCYRIILEDPVGCSDTANICLNEADLIQIDTTITNNTSSLNPNGSIIIDSIFGGTPSFSFSWFGPNNFSSNSQNISNLQGGNYILVLLDNNSCFESYSFIINSNITGCIDPNSFNYDPFASIDDGSCFYLLTYIPDDNFENYLEANGMGDGIALNDSVLTSNIRNVNDLYLDSLSINNLIGIQDFISLNILDASVNPIDSINLSNNDSLTHVYLNYCSLDSLDLSDHSLLMEVECAHNQLVDFDMSNNHALTHLAVYNNQLTNIDVTSNLLLTHLRCSGNLISKMNY